MSHKQAFAVLKRHNLLLAYQSIFVDDVMLNFCLSLFRNMRSKSEGRPLGQVL